MVARSERDEISGGVLDHLQALGSGRYWGNNGHWAADKACEVVVWAKVDRGMKSRLVQWCGLDLWDYLDWQLGGSKEMRSLREMKGLSNKKPLRWICLAVGSQATTRGMAGHAQAQPGKVPSPFKRSLTRVRNLEIS